MLAATRDDSMFSLRLLLVHLRLPFQLLLAPIFMLGAFLVGARPTPAVLFAFLAMHIGIYGGMTAFNSYYDRDEGPIAFLKHPQPATPFVRDGALVLQLAAIIVLLVLRPVSALPAAAFAGMGIAYSHPRWRWKASLAGSFVVVGLGQGVLALATGFLSNGGPVSGLFNPAVAMAATSSAAITLGLYQVTQVYQIDEDRQRGDRSLAVALGWRRALIIGAALLGAGVALLILSLAGRIAPTWAWILSAGVLGLWSLLYLWSRRFDSLDAYANHDWAIGLGALAASVFWIFLLSEWFRSRAG
jgi:1,4-dihydroxy-2-naphthoate octaprenyltransferase